MDNNQLKHNDGSSPWAWFHRLGGVASMSNYYVFHIFSKIMDDPKIEGIIEIGTAYGGMTVGLALEAARRNIPIVTVDIEDVVTEETKRIFKDLYVGQVTLDVFDYLKNFSRVCYLLCDGGDKVKEIQTFAPLLKSGSYVSCHDWLSEIYPKDVEFLKDIADPFEPEDWEKHNVQLATWRIR